MTENYDVQTPEQKSLIGKLLRFCLTNKLIVGLLVLLVAAAGVYFAPFDWEVGGLPRSPVATDAIPDIGENQQIVFTEWMGRSPPSFPPRTQPRMPTAAAWRDCWSVSPTPR